MIHEAGAAAGVAINPGTPPAALAEVGAEIELALCMTVNPGWGGQPFIAHSLEKLPRVRAAVGAHAAIEVDGGIDPDTAPACLGAGAGMFVAGSAIFGERDPAAAYAGDRRARVEGRRAAPVERAQALPRAVPAAARVADLDARSTCSEIAGVNIQPTNTAAASSQQAAAARARSRARAAWLSAPGDEVQAHADADRARARSGRMRSPGRTARAASRTARPRAGRAPRRAAKAAIASTVMRIARANASWPAVASRPVRCGQQRGLDRLEELQRRARDQQHVEDDPRQRRVAWRSRRRSARRRSAASARRA